LFGLACHCTCSVLAWYWVFFSHYYCSSLSVHFFASFSSCHFPILQRTLYGREHYFLLLLYRAVGWWYAIPWL
jgi:hypothetical protein